jgi:hypothetical protein
MQIANTSVNPWSSPPDGQKSLQAENRCGLLACITGCRGSCGERGGQIGSDEGRVGAGNLHRSMIANPRLVRIFRRRASPPALLFRMRPLEMDEAAGALLEGEPRLRAPRLHTALDGLVTWDTEALEAAVRTVADEAGGKPGDMAQPLRAALTGRRTSPAILGAQATPGTEGTLPRFADQMRTPA